MLNTTSFGLKSGRVISYRKSLCCLIKIIILLYAVQLKALIQICRTRKKLIKALRAPADEINLSIISRGYDLVICKFLNKRQVASFQGSYTPAKDQRDKKA